MSIDSVAYCRVSTLKNEQELSLENQVAFFNEYIEKQGDHLIEIYAEKGKSATKMQNRKELQRLLQDAQAGKFKRVYIKDISRAFRNTYDFIGTSRELAKYGVTFYILGMGEHGKDVDEFTANLMAMVAEQESKKMSERVKFGKALGREEGVVPNFVFGYDKVDRLTLSINEEEAFWVRRIFDLYTEQGWGQARIAEELFKNRVKTKKMKNGQPNFVWSTCTVGHILSHQIYIGKLISGKQSSKNLYTYERVDHPEEKWAVHERPELRIVSDEQFQKAQELRAKGAAMLAAASGAHRTSNKHLFSNLIKCGHCGFSYRRNQRGPSSSNRYTQTYIWWTCSRRSAYGKDSCVAEHVRIDEDWLVRGLQKLFDHVVGERDTFFATIEKKCNEFIKEYVSTTVGYDLGQLQERITELQAQRERIKQLAIKGLISDAEVEAEMIPLNEDIKKIKTSLAQADKTTELTEHVKASVKKFIKDFSAVDFTDKLDNLGLKKIIREIRVMSKEEIYVYFNVGGEDGGLDLPISLSDTYLDYTDGSHGT